MIVFRACHKKWAKDLNGEGAKKVGGRWNPKGMPVVYTSANSSLCVLEAFVHFTKDTIPDDYMLVEIEIPNSATIKEIKEKDLPKNWSDTPGPEKLQKLGSDWLKSKSHLILKVPSAANSRDFNFLINPDHPDMKKIKINKISVFKLDSRISQKDKK